MTGKRLIVTPPLIRRRVQALRRRLYGLILLRGLGLLSLAMGLLVALSLLLDWYFRFPRGQRFLLLAAALVALGWVMYRRLLRPLSRRVDDAQLALWIEAAHPDLRGRWLAAVELDEEVVRRQGASIVLAQAAVQAGQAQAQEVQVEKVIRAPFSARARGSALAGALALLALLLAALSPATQPLVRTWWQRNVLLAETAWPTRTRLIFPRQIDQPLAHPLGDDFELTVQVEGDAPPLLRAELWMQDGRGRGPQRVELFALGGGKHRLLVPQLLHPMRLRVAGGDAVSPWLEVRLLERPQLIALQVSADPPAYLDMAPFQAQPGATLFEVPAGSRVHVSMQASSALSWARLSLDAHHQEAMQPAGDFWKAAIPPQKLASGVWTLSFADALGLVARPEAKLAIQVRPDQSPRVQAALRGVGGLVLSGAMLPMEYAAQDDHGLAGVKIQGRWTGGDDAAAQAQNFSQPLSEIQEADVRSFRDGFVLDLRDYAIPVGATVALEIVAWDRDDVHGPNQGVSPTLLVKVVSEAELRADLLRREQEQRRELERLVKDQEDLETQWRALAVAGTRSPAPAEPGESVAFLSRRQRTLADRLEGIHRHLQLLAAEMVHNRLEEPQGPVLTRMRRRVLEPLEQLAQSRFPAISRSIQEVQGTMDRGVGMVLMRQIADLQQEAASRLRDVLEALAHWAGYQEAVQLLQETQRMQRQVHEATRRELEKRVRDLFDE